MLIICDMTLFIDYKLLLNIKYSPTASTKESSTSSGSQRPTTPPELSESDSPSEAGTYH